MTIEDELRRADESWNVMTIGNIIMGILHQNPTITMLEIEDGFRKIESKTTYLVAWPKAMLPRPLVARRIDGRRADYALWVCINGHGDMIRTLFKFGLTEKQNREALKIAGFSSIE